MGFLGNHFLVNMLSVSLFPSSPGAFGFQWRWILKDTYLKSVASRWYFSDWWTLSWQWLWLVFEWLVLQGSGGGQWLGTSSSTWVTNRFHFLCSWVSSCTLPTSSCLHKWTSAKPSWVRESAAGLQKRRQEFVFSAFPEVMLSLCRQFNCLNILISHYFQSQDFWRLLPRNNWEVSRGTR